MHPRHLAVLVDDDRRARGEAEVPLVEAVLLGGGPFGMKVSEERILHPERLLELAMRMMAVDADTEQRRHLADLVGSDVSRD